MEQECFVQESKACLKQMKLEDESVRQLLAFAVEIVVVVVAEEILVVQTWVALVAVLGILVFADQTELVVSAEVLLVVAVVAALVVEEKAVSESLEVFDPFLVEDPFVEDPFAGDPFAGDPFAEDPFVVVQE